MCDTRPLLRQRGGMDFGTRQGRAFLTGQLRFVVGTKEQAFGPEEKHEKAPKGSPAGLDSSPKGRRAKNKARINNYESMLAEGTKEKDARLNIPIPTARDSATRSSKQAA